MSKRHAKVGGNVITLANALVSDAALDMVSPAQAFVDASLVLYQQVNESSFTYLGITHLGSGGTDFLTFYTIARRLLPDGGSVNISFNGCTLDTASVDAYLSKLWIVVDAFSFVDGGTLNIAGGCAAPTDGAANADKVALEGAGFTVNITT